MTTAVPYKVPFDVYLPATKFCKETGQTLNATFVKTIDIDVYDNFGHQMLTEQAHIDIDREKILAYIGVLIEDDMWMDIPNVQFKHKRPIDMLNDHEGQRELIEFIQKVKND